MACFSSQAGKAFLCRFSKGLSDDCGSEYLPGFRHLHGADSKRLRPDPGSGKTEPLLTVPDFFQSLQDA